MGVKFNPPPGWPVPYGFEPPPGWEPDPRWPAPPPGWPLWMGREAPRASYHAGAQPSLLPSYLAEPRGAHAKPRTEPEGYAAPAFGYGQAPSARPPTGTNGLAITSFVLSLFAMAPFSIALGIAALAQLKREPRRGKGLAIAALSISGVWVAVLAVSIIVAIVNIADHPLLGTGRAAAGNGTAGNGQVSIFSLRTGDCFQERSPGQLSKSIAQVASIACTKPHNAQVFVRFPAAGGRYPGGRALLHEASRGCQARAGARLIKSRIKPTMRVQSIVPQQFSWLAGHRTISCVALDPLRDLRVSLVNPGGAR
jgi:hypothetical protein